MIEKMKLLSRATEQGAYNDVVGIIGKVNEIIDQLNKQDEEKKAELKLCPFCDATAEVKRDGGNWWVECIRKDCGVQTRC